MRSVTPGILSDVDIRRVHRNQIRRGQFLISNNGHGVTLQDVQLQPAGYDLTLNGKNGEELAIPPQDQKLVSTKEEVNLPRNLVGLLHLRTTYVRQGLMMSSGLVDPGYKGT